MPFADTGPVAASPLEWVLIGAAAALAVVLLMMWLRERYCIVIVTHSMAQAARVSQRTAFFHLGRLVETGNTEEIFTNPRERRTLDYITGRFG